MAPVDPSPVSQSSSTVSGNLPGTSRTRLEKTLHFTVDEVTRETPDRGRSTRTACGFGSLARTTLDLGCRDARSVNPPPSAMARSTVNLG